MGSHEQYINLFKDEKQTICNNSAPVLNAKRDEAFDCLLANGFPNKKVERYKYTDMQALLEPNYGLNINRLNMPVNALEAFRCAVPNINTSLYYMINDAFKQDMASLTPQNDGIIVGSLREEALKNPQLIEKYYGNLASVANDSLTALNTMFAQDGLFVYVPKNTKPQKAIQVINIMNAKVDLMANRRILIVLEEGAEATMLFCDHTANANKYLTTQVIEVYVSQNASLQLYCMEETNSRNTRISNLYVSQKRNSRFNHNMMTLHNGTTRNSAQVYLQEEGAECSLNGFVIADKHQHTDNNTLIHHIAPHCTSDELYKYVLDDSAVGAFAGKVLVGEKAEKTLSNERNQNLCATKQARMFTQPMLEIYAEDVKCSHGSTVGQLNDSAIFYMQQRGIPLKEAKLLLQTAFVNEVVERMQLPPLKERLYHLIEKRFRGELSTCSSCHNCI